MLYKKNTLKGSERHCQQNLSVSWCFMPSQPQRVLPGLRETFIKKYVAAMTSEAEIRPEGQSEKAESCRENLGNELQLKGP